MECSFAQYVSCPRRVVGSLRALYSAARRCRRMLVAHDVGGAGCRWRRMSVAAMDCGNERWRRQISGARTACRTRSLRIEDNYVFSRRTNYLGDFGL